MNAKNDIQLNELVNADWMYCTNIPHPSFFHKHTVQGPVVILSPLTSEARVLFPAWPQVGKLVAACRWLAVYSTEP